MQTILKHYLVVGTSHKAVIVAVGLRDAQEYNRSIPGLGGQLTEVNPASLSFPFCGYTTPRAQQAIRDHNRQLGIY